MDDHTCFRIKFLERLGKVLFYVGAISALLTMPAAYAGISIHTLHTEGDSKYKQLYHICTSINCTIYPII